MLVIYQPIMGACVCVLAASHFSLYESDSISSQPSHTPIGELQALRERLFS